MNKDEALKAINTGAVLACVSAVLTLGITLFAIYSDATDSALSIWDDSWNLLDFFLILGLAYSVYRKSRTGAIALFVYYLLARMLIVVETGMSAGVGMTLVFLYFYGNAVRGTFAYHRIEKAENPEHATGFVVPTIAGIGLMVLLGLFALSFLEGRGTIPSSGILEGGEVGEEVKSLLIANDVLLPDEEIQLFFSEGIVSILEGGSFLSNRGVTIYFRNEDGSLSAFELTFPEIGSVKLVRQGNTLDYSEYSVENTTGDVSLPLILPAEDGQDVRFVEAIRRKIGQ